MSPAKTAEPIEMPFGMWTGAVTGNHVLNWDAHWRNLANMIEPCTLYSDAALCKITPLVYINVSAFCCCGKSVSC